MATLTVSLDVRVQSDDGVILESVGNLKMHAWQFEHADELSDWLKSDLGGLSLAEEVREGAVDEVERMMRMAGIYDRQVARLESERDGALQHQSAAAE